MSVSVRPRPLVVGYMSVLAGAGEFAAAGWEASMRVVAAREGYGVWEVFSDARGSFAGYRLMREAVALWVARAVVVPSLKHLAHVPGLARVDARQATRVLGVRLLVAEPDASRVATGSGRLPPGRGRG